MAFWILIVKIKIFSSLVVFLDFQSNSRLQSYIEVKIYIWKVNYEVTWCHSTFAMIYTCQILQIWVENVWMRGLFDRSSFDKFQLKSYRWKIGIKRGLLDQTMGQKIKKRLDWLSVNQGSRHQLMNDKAFLDRSKKILIDRDRFNQTRSRYIEHTKNWHINFVLTFNYQSHPLDQS